MGRLSFDKKLNSNQLRDLDDIIRFFKYKNHRFIKIYIKEKYKVNTSITAVHRYMQNKKKKDIDGILRAYRKKK